LLVGDVDFSSDPGKAQTDQRGTDGTGSPPGVRRKWEALPATRDEVVTVRDSFERFFKDKGKVTLLREDEATKATGRKEAPKHRWLHVATHGFFAPKEWRSVLAPSPGGGEPGLMERGGVIGFHPGLLSGLVLAGANRPADPKTDDGYLTALEVADLDL